MSGNRFFALNAIKNLINGITPTSVDTSAHKTSKSTRITGNDTVVFITPEAGHRIIVKSVYISTEANNGEARIEFTNGEEILPLFIDNRTKSSAGDFNQEGAVDDTVQLVVEGANTDIDTFFGVSYIETDR